MQYIGRDASYYGLSSRKREEGPQIGFFSTTTQKEEKRAFLFFLTPMAEISPCGRKDDTLEENDTVDEELFDR